MSTSYTVDARAANPSEWEPRLVPLLDGCRRLHLSRSTAYRMIAQGRFPVEPLRVGGRWFVRTTDLDRVTGSI